MSFGSEFQTFRAATQNARLAVLALLMGGANEAGGSSCTQPHIAL